MTEAAIPMELKPGFVFGLVIAALIRPYKTAHVRSVP